MLVQDAEDAPVTETAPAVPAVEKPAEENPAFPKAFVTFAGAAAISAIGLELLTNEYEKNRALALAQSDKGMTDIIKQLSMEKALIGLGKCALGWYLAEKVSGKMMEGFGIGAFVSGVADFVEVIGWNMATPVFQNTISATA
jgi:hypothetical protein